MSRKNLRKQWGQRGDTIVEVMIATLVLSLVIGAAYALATRSLKVARQSQERGEALKLAERQVENIKAAAASNDPGSLFSVPVSTAFCMNPGVVTEAGACRFDNLYDVQIHRDNPVGNSYQFNVVIEWDSFVSAGRDRVTMHYRVLEESDD